jgi:hypothetical protein
VGADCDPGPVGDGGSATSARLGAPAAVAALGDGGFLVADRGTGLVRRVDSAGIITTIAGTADPGRGLQIGGPATQTHLDDPRRLAVAPDGRVFIADAARILAVAPDGRLQRLTTLSSAEETDQIAAAPGGALLILHDDTITRVSPTGQVTRLAQLTFPAVGLVARADGSALTINTRARQIVRVAADGTARLVIASSAFRDFAGREPGPDLGGIDPQSLFEGLAEGPEGLFVAVDSSVLLVPRSATTRPGVRIVAARVSQRAVRLEIRAAQPGSVTLTQLRVTPLSSALAQAQTSLTAGTHWLTLPVASRRHGLFRLQVELATTLGTADDSVSLVLGRSLPARLVEAVMSSYDGKGGWPFTCRGMSARRVDCFTGFGGGNSCETMLAVRAGPDGLLYRRDYPCAQGKPRFRRTPRFSGGPSIVVPLI